MRMERYVVSSLGVLLAGSIGAFLLYVPILPLAAVVLVLLGLILMFFLGLYLGVHETSPIGSVKQQMTMWRRLVWTQFEPRA